MFFSSDQFTNPACCVVTQMSTMGLAQSRDVQLG